MNVIWTSHGAQLQRDINSFLGQMNQMGGQLDRQSRKLSLWGQQMKAIGTTIRYALAGATVYAVATAVSSLGEFENKLGELDALLARAGAGGKLQSWGDDINRVGDIALRASNKYGIAVDQIQQFQRVLASSFDIPRGKQGLDMIQSWTKAMSELSLISEGADPIALGQATAALIDRPGQIKTRVPEIVSAFSHVISRSKIIHGEDIARDVGRLSGARTAIRMTPEQVLGVYLAASQRGGSAPLVGRGVAQLLTASLVNPKTETQKTAFQRVVGTSDPNELRRLGGMEILRRIFANVAPQGARIRNRRALTNIGLEDEEAIAAAGPQGIDVKTITQLLGRIESTRQILNLISVGGFPVIKRAVDGILKAERQREGTQRANIVNERRWYQQLGQAQKNLGLTFTRGLEPFFRPAAAGIQRLSNAAIGHPTAVVGAIGGIAAASLAARIAMGTGLGGLLGRGLGRIPGLRRAGLGGVLARAPEFGAAQLIGGGVGAFQATGIGETKAGSRSNPMWVVIDPQSWFFPGAPAGQGVAPQSPIQPLVGPGGTARTTAGRLGLAGTAVTSVGISAGILAGMEYDRRHRPSRHPGLWEDFNRGFFGIPGGIRRQGGRDIQSIRNLFGRGVKTDPDTQREVYRWFNQVGGFPGNADRFLRNMQGHSPQRPIQIEGEAKADVTVRLTDAEGRKIADKTIPGVPVKLWNQGNPRHRGRQRAHRRGAHDAGPN